MNRTEAAEFTRLKLQENGLSDWKVRINPDPNYSYLGMCSYKDKAIILNGYHIEIHGEAEVINTIYHEIAHALVGPNHGHDNVWATKAREIGCDNTEACSTLSMPAHVIDAIRSGHSVEVIVEEKEVVTKVRDVKHVVTRLQEKCPECGKVAIEKFAIESVDRDGNQCKLITLECFHIIKKIIPKATPFESMVSFWWKPEVAGCIHKWNKNQCENCGEFKLFNFQVNGARFAEAALATAKGALIADEMGLGKTVQGLAILRFHGKTYNRAMVVTKSAITFQWFKQAVRWLGPEYIGQVITTSKDYLYPGLKLYIISYDLLRRMKKEKLHGLGINLVILDECQQIKNPDSARTQEVRKLVSANPSCKVLELSGTPWKNRGAEFFSALNLIDPVKFYSYQHFLDTWVEFYWEGNKKKMGGIRNIPKFKEYIGNLVIRREYDEVMDEFPDVNRTKLAVKLDDLTQSAYDDEEDNFVKWYNDKVIGGEEDKISGIEILAQMARMRHLSGLSKIPATLSYVDSFFEETDKKLVVFVHHIDVGEMMYRACTDTSDDNPYQELAQRLKDEGVWIRNFTGGLSGEQKFMLGEDFNKAKRALMFASTQAAGEGIDLQTCADSILHERQWNPQNEDQATPGRFKRIGQTAKTINITCVEGEGTIDEDLDYIVEGKRRRFHAVHNQGDVPTWDEGEIGKELAAAIVKRHQTKVRGKKKASTNAAAILSR